MILRSVTVAMAVLLGGLPVLGQDYEKFRGSGKGCIHPEPPPNSPRTEASSGGIVWAYYVGATTRYKHGVLGDDIEAIYVLTNLPGAPGFCDSFSTPIDSVFEDIAPRLADIDGDGQNEVIVVESDKNKGARLAIYGYPEKGKGFDLVAATPHIGTPYRWLAPIGVADFNGDGDMDVAYVDRPHLAKTLRVWTYRNGGLTEIASLRGVTNHKIGEPFITSSIRTCDGRPEMILTDGARKNIVSIFFEHDRLKSRVLGRFSDRKSVDPPPAC